MCKTCKYLENENDNDPKNPCNTCIVWGDDGYKDFRNYEWEGADYNAKTAVATFNFFHPERTILEGQIDMFSYK